MGWTSIITNAWTTATGDLKAYEPEALVVINVVFLASLTVILIKMSTHSDVERPGGRSKYILAIVIAVIAMVFANVIVSGMFGNL